MKSQPSGAGPIIFIVVCILIFILVAYGLNQPDIAVIYGQAMSAFRSGDLLGGLGQLLGGFGQAASSLFNSFTIRLR